MLGLGTEPKSYVYVETPNVISIWIALLTNVLAMTAALCTRTQYQVWSIKKKPTSKCILLVEDMEVTTLHFIATGMQFWIFR